MRHVEAPLQSAIGYGQRHAARRLHERGAITSPSGLAILGLADRAAEGLTSTFLDPEVLSLALWNACRVGDIVVARMLIDGGADIAWRASWSGEALVDIARSAGQEYLLPWLECLQAGG